MPELIINMSKGFKGDSRAVGLDDFKKELERRVCRLKGWYANHIYKAMVLHPADEKQWAHLWSGYFRANWNVTVGHEDFSTMGPRGWDADPDNIRDAYGSSIDREKSKKLLDGYGNALLNQPIYICNGVWYGKWLRDGVPASYLPGLSGSMSGGQAQESQMASLGPDGAEYVNFQQSIETEASLIDWDFAMYRIRREKAGRALTDRVHVKTYIY